MKIAPQVDSFRQERVHLFHDGFERPGTNAVLAIRYSVFEYINRFLETGEMLHRLPQAFRINFAIRYLDAGVSLGLVGRNRNLDKESLEAAGLKAYAQSTVVVDPNIVTGAFDFGQRLPDFI